MTNPIRVLIAEDSITIRERLAELLRESPEFEVAALAGNGREAIEACQRLRPDVITMDMMMPELTGLEATEQIMAYTPTPILIVSSSTNRGELFKTYEALAAGAVDVLEKPLGTEFDQEWERKFVSALKTAARVKVITHPRAKLARPSRTPLREIAVSPSAETCQAPATLPSLVAIGVSTGGPGALLEIVRGLPADFPLPILLVIHIGHPFDTAFNEWLDSHSPIRVRKAVDGEPLPKRGCSCILMAPSDQHMILQEGRIRLTNAPERHSCRPSVDVLFESLAREHARETIACLLTGMGRDGAAGLLQIRLAGGLTLAQDEATSVIFGMPREAIQLGAPIQVLPLGSIAGTLVSLSKHAEEVHGKTTRPDSR